ncbi:MAG: NAD(P)H-binding protein [Opitutaceae bacterium]|nr:NAD(P)H-binding protein [Cytophagales bacterium]
MKTAVIAGSTGLVGKQLMYKLLECKDYQKIIALVRTPLQIKHPKLVQLTVDYDKLDQYKDQMQGDDYFCCLGTTMKKAGSKVAFYKVDYTYAFEFAKIASENVASKFLLISAIGADSSSSVYYSKVKGELEEAIKKLKIPEIHIFQPSILVGNRLEFRFGEIIGIGVAKAISPLLISGLRKYKPMDVTKLAQAMLNVALQKETMTLKTWSYNEIMSII